MLFIVLFIARKGIRLYARLQGSVDTMVRKVRGDYGGIRVIKALSREDYEREAFRGIAGEVAQSETRANLVTGVSNPAVSLLLNLGMVAVVLVGAFRVEAGVMPARQDRRFRLLFHPHPQRGDDGQPPLRHPRKGHRLFPPHLRRAQRPRGAPSAPAARRGKTAPSSALKTSPFPTAARPR